MPIDLDAPKVFTIDKLRIDLFSVEVQNNHVVIHFSRGYEDENGTFTPKEWDKVDIKSVSFDSALYSEVKELLYTLLKDALTARDNPTSLVDSK